MGKMSLRTLVCVAGGFACAIASACIVYFVFHIEVGSATLPVMAAALPFWLAGFWRPFGMKLEEFLPYLLDHHLGSTRLLYASPQQAGEPIQAGPIPGKAEPQIEEEGKTKGAERHEPSKQARVAPSPARRDRPRRAASPLLSLVTARSRATRRSKLRRRGGRPPRSGARRRTSPRTLDTMRSTRTASRRWKRAFSARPSSSRT